ncbi:hypothetical protein JL720_12258 [Aureococcus anophagefferens]|nr:hypothetical protein JL720_12258 [Aureococcus anophagefferens]
MDDDDDEDPYNFDLAGDDDLGYGDDDSASMSYSPARRAAARPRRVRSINDLNDARAEERAGAPPTRDSESTFDFGGRGDDGLGAASALPRRAVENSSPPRGKPAERPGKPGAARRTVSFDGDGALSSDAAPLHSSGGSPGGALEESLAEDDSDGDRTVGQRDAAGSSDSGENYEGESVADDDDAAPNAPNVRSFSDLAAVAAPESSDGDDDAEEYSDEFGNESPASRSPRSGPEPPRRRRSARRRRRARRRRDSRRRPAPDPAADAKVDEHTARELRREAKHARAAREAAGRNADLTDSEDNERGDERPPAAAAKTRRVRSHAGHVFFTVRLGLLAIEHLDGTARDVFVADVAAALGVSRRASTSSARASGPAAAGPGGDGGLRAAPRGRAREAPPALPFDASAAPPRSPTFLIDNAASLAHADDATLANVARAYIAQASAARDAGRARPPPPGPLFGSYPPPPPTFAAYRPPPAPLPAPAPPPDVAKTPRTRDDAAEKENAPAPPPNERAAGGRRARGRAAAAADAAAPPTPPRPDAGARAAARPYGHGPYGRRRRRRPTARLRAPARLRATVRRRPTARPRARRPTRAAAARRVRAAAAAAAARRPARRRPAATARPRPTGGRAAPRSSSLADQHLAELHAERAAGTTALNAPDAALPQMLAAQADLSRQLEGLRAKLAESRATYDAASARPPSTEAHHTLAATQEYIDTHRPAPLPYWKAHMSVDASLTEEEARQLAFDDVKHKRGAAAPVSAVAATTASAAAGPDGPDGGVGEAKEG